MRLSQLFLAVMFIGCNSLKPEKISLPNYPDLEEIYISQYQALGSGTLDKEVTLDAEKEANSFQMDTTMWKEELEFLSEINPNKPEYVGMYETIEDGVGGIVLQLLEGEKSTLKQVAINYREGQDGTITATIHEDKDVYVHHREIEVRFTHGLISSWNIEGYQKMMFKDTVRFEIAGKVN